MKLLTLAVLAFSAATVDGFMVPHAQPIRSTASKMVTTSSRISMGRKAARAARLGTWAAETKVAAERKAAGTTQKKKKAAARGSTAAAPKKSKPAPEPVAEEPAPAVEEAPAPAPEPEPEP